MSSECEMGKGKKHHEHEGETQPSVSRDLRIKPGLTGSAEEVNIKSV